MIDKIEAIEGVIGVIIGQSYGGKSLGKQSRTGAVKVQRIDEGGLKAATQSAKGLQELFIRTAAGKEKAIAEKIAELT
jgi:2-keto-3-deoxy-L-rhamnonate aldolase RhmA